MTSFDPSSPSHADCPFCAIAAAHPPYDALHPPPPPPAQDPQLVATPAPAPALPPSTETALPPLSPSRTTPSSFVVLSTPTLIAFLDILPLSPGHLLLCPRAHRPKLTDTTPREASLMGTWARFLSAALARVTGVEDWNVVQNNGAAAAQVVPHVHFHVIPRPEIRASGRFSESFTMFGRGVREDLDDDEAAALAARLREEVAAVLRDEGIDGDMLEGIGKGKL